VIAAAVGGLTVAVADGISGLLVAGHDPGAWADALASVVLDPAKRERMSSAAPLHAARFSWEVTVDGLLASYDRALHRDLPPAQWIEPRLLRPAER
jgi:D-inositol-3-phosphate glycosyltransferase